MARILRRWTFVYRLLFGEEPSEAARHFLKNCFYIFWSSGLALIFSFLFNTLAGRFLGPTIYGQFALIQSVAMLLYLPMVLGFSTAMVKYNAESDDLERRSEIISTTYLIILFLIIFFSLIFIILAKLMAGIFFIPVGQFILAVVFAGLFVFYSLTTDTLRGLHLIKQYALLQPLYGFLLLSVFLLLFLFLSPSFHLLLFPLYSAYILCGIGALFFTNRVHLRFKLSLSWAKRLARYALLALLGGVAFVLSSNFDKILLNRYLSLTDVGVYKAYYFASINIAIIAFSSLNIIFFPTASRHLNKIALWKKINRLTPYFFIGGGFIFFALQWFILKLFGRQYPIHVGLMILFTLASLVVLVNSCYVWLVASEGRRGIKITAFSETAAAGANIILNLILIPRFGIIGAVLSCIGSYGLFLFLVLWRGGRFIKMSLPSDV